MKKIILILLTAFSVNSIAQQADKFIYLPYTYNFCLESHDICINIPENWGFQVPFLKDHDARLSIYSDMVEYAATMKTGNIQFVLPNSTKPCMELRIMSNYETENNDEGIKSNWGSFQLIDQTDTSKVEAYQNISYNGLLTFRILTQNEKEKQLCRAIIASAQSVYNTMYTASHNIEYYAKDSTYYPSLGLTHVVPVDAYAVVKAPKININEPSTLLTAYGSLDELSKESTETSFSSPEFNVTYKFYKLNDTLKLYESINYYKENYDTACYRTFEYSVSNIPATFYLLGSPYAPNLIAVIPTKNYYATFDFGTISKANIDNVNTFISQLSIIDSLHVKTNKNIPSSSLQELIAIEDIDLDSYAVSVTLPNKKLAKDIKIIKCKIPELKAEIYIPDFGQTTYNDDYEREYKKGDIVINLNNLQYSPYAVISRSNYDDKVAALMVAADTATTVQEFIKKEYLSHQCEASYDNNRININAATVNGQKWYVVAVDGYKFYFTEVKGRIISLILYKDENSTIMESLLHKASFK